MAASSGTDVAAKMIGAQLQSLLKIPPIQKAETPPETGVPDERRSIRGSTREPLSGPYQYPKRSEEKENSGGGSSKFSGVGADPSRNMPKDSIPRDRFGRPFQNLGHRGRGRERDRDHQAGNRRFNPEVKMGNHPAPLPRDDPVVEDRPTNEFQASRPKALPDTGTMERQYPPNQNARPTPQPPAPPKPKQEMLPARESTEVVVVEPGGVKVARWNANNFYQQSVEQPPSEFRGGQQLEEMSVAQLLRHPNMPHDMRENKHLFFDKDLAKNEAAWNILQLHCINNLFFRRNPRFPRAKFYCNLCNFHIDNLQSTLAHLLQNRHSVQEKGYVLSLTNGNIPPPSPEHIFYLNDLLMRNTKVDGINEIETNRRFELVDRIRDAMKLNDLHYQAILFGSSVSGFALKTSDVNINISVGEPAVPVVENGVLQTASAPKHPVSYNPAEFREITAKLVNIIKEVPFVTKSTVKEVYTTKCASIHFFEEQVKAPCVLHFNNTSAVLAAELFAEYEKIDPRVKPLVLGFRQLAKVFGIDDAERGFLAPHCYAIMVIFFLQKKDILPVLHLICRSPGRLFASADQAKRRVKLRGTKDSVAELFLKLLKFYGQEFPYKDYIISISRLEFKLDKEEKQWNKRICIEDPIISNSNLSRSIINNKLCDYIIDRFKLATKYFGIPRSQWGPLYDGIFPQHFFRREAAVKYSVRIAKPTTGHAVQRKVWGTLVEPNKEYHEEGMEEVKVFEMLAMKIVHPEYQGMYIERASAVRLRDILYKNEYCYEFKLESLSDGCIPPIICKACGNEGHLRSGCPEETIPPFQHVNFPSPVSLSRLNTAININFAREAVDSRDVAVRKSIQEDLQAILLPAMPGVNLTLFGSSLNGFGMHSSDVDLCLVFDNIDIPPGGVGLRMINHAVVIEMVETTLKASSLIKDVVAIGTAKVPIVKFRHTGYNADGDVSLYNRLSVHNTNLLKAYTDLDERVAPLGLFLKKLVKLCNIGDASKGSLSSYCYILMLIHFLQNHTTPVLPVLQKLNYSKKNGILHCDGHCVEFEENLDLVRKKWKPFGKNKESMSQLWLGFLNYYVEKFDNEKFVVTISQTKPLSRQDKCWYTEALAIEDPFDKTHNLGNGLTRRMSVHILKTFQRCREFFHQNTDHLANEVPLLEYYFKSSHISIGSPPIDRQCRICRTIGHIAKNCTNKTDGEQTNNAPISLPVPKKEPVVPEAPATRISETMKLHLPIQNDTLISNMARDNNGNLPLSTNAVSGSEPLTTTDPAVLYTKLPNGIAELQRDVKPRNTKLDQDILSLFKNQRISAPRPLVSEAKVKEDIKPMVKAEIQQLKEEGDDVVFFGDIGGANAEGDRIKAMLQRNEGVTFTFEVDKPPLQSKTDKEDANRERGYTPVMPPPPGFIPAGRMFSPRSPIIRQPPPPAAYIGSGMQNHGLVAIPHSQPGIPVPYGHNPVVGAPPYQPIIAVSSAPFELRPLSLQRNGEVGERAQTMSGSAPPPGFAPLIVTTSSGAPPSQTPDLVRSYQPPYSVAPIAPPQMGMNFQQHNGFSTSLPHVSSSVADQPGGYRHLERDDTPHQAGINFEIPPPMLRGSPVVTSTLLMQSPVVTLTPTMPGFQGRQGLFFNSGAPNGHPDNSIEGSITQHISAFKSGMGSQDPQQQVFNAEFGGNIMPPGGAPAVVSYGLSLSQAHHAPVVSALQMQHSQHHPPVPVQGGHFHHSVRPFMATGGYGGNTYSYPTPVQVAHALPPPPGVPHIQDSSAMPMHGVDMTPPPWK